jgi:HPt (histidine-containing phosphotransfer) domain-containing protein
MGGDDTAMTLLGGTALPNVENNHASASESRDLATDLPIDLDYLKRQTLADPALQREVLMLFREQAASVRVEITELDGEERSRLAHGLRGSASGIGAFAISHCAKEVEHDPAASDSVARLTQSIDDALVFIDEISR